VETAEQVLPDRRDPGSSDRSPIATRPNGWAGPVKIEPDLDFIRALTRHGGGTFKKCMQCGTCSSTCDISPDGSPFPGKEMAWCLFGVKARALAAPGVWLCHQCNDCSTICPRGARPGEVLGAVRQEAVRHYAVPRFLGRWVNEPHCIPLVLGVATTLLTLALVVRDPVEKALSISHEARDRIIFHYSSFFPHWLLNTFFGLFSLLALLAVAVGVTRFWRAMKGAVPPDRIANPRMGLFPSILTTLKSVFRHDKFEQCTKARSRFFSHYLVFFGFLALTVVTCWVITSRYNPLIKGDFIYPFPIWSPWKLLANVGGIALVTGCVLMIRNRLRESEQPRGGSYFDYWLIVTLLAVAATGFITEVLHYLRLEPHRHVAYFVHLVFVFATLIYLPYSKLAHMFYRTAALVFAERYGYGEAVTAPGPAPGPDRERKE